MQKLVLDTNVVLDLFVFGDEAARGLHTAIGARQIDWLATAAMRDELQHVLAYPNILARMQEAGTEGAQVLAAFDTHARMVDTAAPAKVACRDGDDQKFIDLAVAHRATLLSKDKQVLTLRRKLAFLDVAVMKAL
jgi:putative PIN family toxin of toxin-antitoxin system